MAVTNVVVTTFIGEAARLLLLCAPLASGARSSRRLLAPAWRGARAALADLVGSIAAGVVISESLGSFGQFRYWPLTAAALVFAAATELLRRRRATNAPALRLAAHRGPAAGSLTSVVVAASSSALVLSQWSTWSARTLRYGIGNIGGPGNGDTLWYHMPFAASFVQSGWTSHLQYLNGEALVTYYPANTSVLHALGILAVHSDVLSPFINIGLVPVALLAGWCIGERHGLAPACLAGVAVALTIPTVVVSDAGSAKDDVLGIVGLLGAVAFLEGVASSSLRGRSDRAPGVVDLGASVYGGLAAGLAIGSKLTLVAPIALLAVALFVLSPSGARIRTILPWLGGAFATGGYWYARNTVAIGNPIPGLKIGIGPWQLPRPHTPSMDEFGTNLLHNLRDTRVWHDALLPGLKTGFGSAWPIPLAIVLAATTVGIVVFRGRERITPLVGLLALLAFFVTPGTVWAPQLIGFPGVHFTTANLFAFNLRYGLPAVALGLVTLPLVARRFRGGAILGPGLIGVALASMQLAPQGRRSWIGGQLPIALSVAVIAFAVTAAAIIRPPWLRAAFARRYALRWLAVAAAGACLLGIGAWRVQKDYLRNRYGGLDLARWASTLKHSRIGYSGFVFSYPLYGARLQNRVQMIGEHGPEGAWHPARTCEGWRRDVRLSEVQYLVVPVGPPAIGLGIDLSRWRVGLPSGEPPDEPPESRWTRQDRAYKLVFRSAEGAAVYRVTKTRHPDSCQRHVPVKEVT